MCVCAQAGVGGSLGGVFGFGGVGCEAGDVEFLLRGLGGIVDQVCGMPIHRSSMHV